MILSTIMIISVLVLTLCLLYCYRVLLESWRHIQQHCQQETLHRSKVLTSLEEKVVQPLSVFLLSDLEKRFQNVC